MLRYTEGLHALFLFSEAILKSRKNTQGFTLIELVSVIVILSVISAVVTPKLIDITEDAKGAVLESIAGALSSQLNLVFAKALVEKQHLGDGQIEHNGTTISLYNGYPAVDGQLSFNDINNLMLSLLDIDAVNRNIARQDNNAAQFFTDKSTRNNQIYIFYSEDYSQKGVNFNCQIRYQNQDGGDGPEVRVLTEAC